MASGRGNEYVGSRQRGRVDSGMEYLTLLGQSLALYLVSRLADSSKRHLFPGEQHLFGVGANAGRFWRHKWEGAPLEEARLSWFNLRRAVCLGRVVLLVIVKVEPLVFYKTAFTGGAGVH